MSFILLPIVLIVINHFVNSSSFLSSMSMQYLFWFLENNIYEYFLIKSNKCIKRSATPWQVKLNALNCALFNRKTIFVWDLLCQHISQYSFCKYHSKCLYLAYQMRTLSYTIGPYKSISNTSHLHNNQIPSLLLVRQMYPFKTVNLVTFWFFYQNVLQHLGINPH